MGVQYMHKVTEIVEQASRLGFAGEDLSQAYAEVPRPSQANSSKRVLMGQTPPVRVCTTMHA